MKKPNVKVISFNYILWDTPEMKWGKQNWVERETVCQKQLKRSSQPIWSGVMNLGWLFKVAQIKARLKIPLNLGWNSSEHLRVIPSDAGNCECFFSSPIFQQLEIDGVRGLGGAAKYPLLCFSVLPLVVVGDQCTNLFTDFPSVDCGILEGRDHF